MIHVLVSERKAFTFEEYLGDWGREVAARMRLHTYEALPSRTSFEGGTWIFTDLDELEPAILRLAESLADALSTEGLPVLNQPGGVMRRRQLLEALHQRGLNSFAVSGLDGDLDGLRFPVFVRRASDHLGPVSPLVHSPQELDRWLGKTVVWGIPRDDVLVIEFLDTSDAEGFYRKYAAFVVGGRILPRSLNRGTGWMVKHGTTDFTVAFQKEELAYVEENPHREALERVVAVAGVDYGRIDYALHDGRVQTWEINLCPTIGRGSRPSTTYMPDEARELRRRAKERFYRDFADAWRRVDRSTDGVAVPAPFSETERQAARETIAARPETGDRRRERQLFLRRALQPIKPLLQPAVDRILMPILGKIVRR